jgi:hypothetical protein
MTGTTAPGAALVMSPYRHTETTRRKKKRTELTVVKDVLDRRADTAAEEIRLAGVHRPAKADAARLNTAAARRKV